MLLQWSPRPLFCPWGPLFLGLVVPHHPLEMKTERYGVVSQGWDRLAFQFKLVLVMRTVLGGPAVVGGIQSLSARQGEAQMFHTGCMPCPERLESICALYLDILPLFGLCVLHACSHALLLSSWDRVCSSPRILWVIPRGQRSLQGTHTPFTVLFLGIPLGWAALPRDSGGAW